ncbi:hypothetical protein KEM56_004242 [Ascosphaera pollenicola]|nr:hypothetical protein KEM56_004242 [Ascosphaera pollenicola]
MGKATSSSSFEGPSTAAAAAASARPAAGRRSARPNRGSDAAGSSSTSIAARDEEPRLGAGHAATGAGVPVIEKDDGDDGEEEDEEEEEESDDDEDEDEDEEPWFKSQSVSRELRSIYRNGDAASCFVTSGDKMVIGTHNGCIHVISTSSFELVRSYRAHRATVTSISISPFPYSTVISNTPRKHALETLDEGIPSSDTASMFSVRSTRTITGSRTAVKHSNTPSGTIYVASSSVEGNVCVASLSDPKDVMLRNFGRPVHTVALSPNYSKDRTFLSGGTAGSLVLTVGGRIGGKSDATILGSGLASTSSGWLNSLGLAANRGKDSSLHDGEGTINTIKWSQSGKFVMWVNEEGIKVMRSNVALQGQQPELAWRRLSHIDRPKTSDWNDMAGLWKARAEWVNRESLEMTDASASSDSTVSSAQKGPAPQDSDPTNMTEKLIVGWGGTIWVVDVTPTEPQSDQEPAQKKGGSVTITTILRTDCIISGVSLYTPSILLVLAYVEKDDDDDDNDNNESSSQQAPRRRGPHHKRNGLQPELRLIDIESKKQIAADPQEVNRYETLSSSDYHMGIIPPPRVATAVRPKSTLDTLWDATVVQPSRLISSAASIRSTFSSSQPAPHTRRNSFAPTTTSIAESDKSPKDTVASSKQIGSSKIVILTPYDCVSAVKRGLRDRLAWLEERERYDEAWNLIDQHPEAFQASGADADDAATIISQDGRGNLSTDAAFDETLSTLSSLRLSNPTASKEKARLGELWLNQLVAMADWKTAGETCGKVLKSTSQWEHWVTKFTENGKFDEITPYVPANLESPLPSVIYEVLLNHYISVDRFKARELLEQWPSTLFEPTSVIDAIERELPLIDQDTEEWRITIGSIAQLYLASGRYREALRCYIELGDVETTMALISQYHLLEAVGEDITSIILLHVPTFKLTKLPIEELEAATSDVIKLLVSGASNGIVRPETVIAQLRSPKYRVFLYFYMKALWTPTQSESEKPRGRFRRQNDGQTNALNSPQAAGQLRADESRAVLDNFADVVVEIFAEFDRPLLMDFLQSSTAYSFDVASSICDAKHYTKELIFLLSKTGETKRALGLILSDLNDVSAAIAFAKQQNDPELWEDLLSYSMDKPACIRGLLKEAGTIINPISLVRRIPSGLEIEGLRDGLTHLIREYDIQASISEGVARVLLGEVAMRMEALRKERRRGIKFNISARRPREKQQTQQASDARRGGPVEPLKRVKTIVAAAAPPDEKETPEQLLPEESDFASHCAGCNCVLVEGQEQETLVAFGCGHIYHLSHIHLPGRPRSSRSSSSMAVAAEEGTADAPSGKKSGADRTMVHEPSASTSLNDRTFTHSRTIGPKVTTARLIQDELRSGCQFCISGNKTAEP